MVKLNFIIVLKVFFIYIDFQEFSKGVFIQNYIVKSLSRFSERIFIFTLNVFSLKINRDLGNYENNIHGIFFSPSKMC